MTRSGQRRDNTLRLQNAEQETMEIDLAELFIRMLDKWYWIILSALICTLIMGVYTFQFVTPQYQSTSKLYVVNSKNSAINLSDLQIGNYLAQDYQEVFHNWHVQDRVIEELGLNYSYGQLRGMVSVSNPTNTRILYITVTSRDPEEARLIASTFAKVACEFIAVKMDQQQPNIFEEARHPMSPSSPNKSRNLMLGFLIGMLAAIAVVVIQYLADDKIRTPEDVEKVLGLPTLGVVTEQSSFRHGSSERKNRNRKQRGEKA